YPEPIPLHPPERPALRQAFWAGSVYRINARSVARVSEALRRIDCSFVLTSPGGVDGLRQQGLAGDHLRSASYPTRSEYLEAVSRQGIQILALDWPDESP